jgi:TRAP-type C4-dicarboxylate transport system substrate-binding protein|tara:strand:- start:292 stop:1323 length:1032 start_codon:yes stop_codon:yes gene_type:complete
MKKFLAGISVSVISTLLSFSAFADGHKVLTVASWAAPFHTQNENVFPWMNDELSSCSGGTLGLKVEYGLAPPPALYDSIRDGVADMTWIVYGYTPGKFVTTMIAELPLIPGNAQEKSVAFQKTYEKYLEAAGEAKGVQILANFTHGPGMANTTKKITSYKELEGVKMRVGGGVANAIGTALGIAGVNAPAPKVYEIISGGVADGVMFPFETMHAFKIAELAKYSLSNPDGMYTTAFAVIMNDDTYNDLSASHKKCIDDMRGVSLSRKIGNYWDQADEVGKASAAEYNHELTIANNDERQYFKAKMGPVIEDVLAKINAVGVDASGALSYFKEEVKVENLLSGN